MTTSAPSKASKLYTLRRSPIQGTGAFAARPITKGTRIIEYLGERISQKEADSRYDDDDPTQPVLLFNVDRGVVIDAGVGGNDARFFNHSCDPNCDAVIDKRRVFIEAMRDIEPGEELTYDYSLTRDGLDDEESERRYACHCGSTNCRGTMLEPRPKRRPKRKQARRKT
jgi:SET domain-containing protein